MASRIFLSAPEPKDPRLRDHLYLEWIATTTCCVACLRLTGKMNRQVQCAHVRAAQAQYQKRETGMQTKPSDFPWVIGLCAGHHVGDKRSTRTSQHSQNEIGFWEGMGINIFDLCLAMGEAYKAGKPGIPIIAQFVGQARRKEGPRD